MSANIGENRKTEIEQMWETLDQHSAILTGPRRMGKTELLSHMHDHPRDRWVVVSLDVQGSESAATLARLLRNRLNDAGLGPSRTQQATEAVQQFNVSAPGVGGLGLELRDTATDPWAAIEQDVKRALDATTPKRLLITLDEVPWLLGEIRERQGDAAARTALAKLRALRHRFPDRLRLLLTGSVGLAGLAHDIGASAELNDLTIEQLPPLTLDWGSALFESEAPKATQAASRYAHQLAGGFPHWLKMLAQRSQRHTSDPIEKADVDRAVDALLRPQQRALFADDASEHFRRRYATERAERLKRILSAAATSEVTPAEALIAEALAQGAPTRAIAMSDLLELNDSYHLEERQDPATGERGYAFVLPLLQRWWQRYGEYA